MCIFLHIGFNYSMWRHIYIISAWALALSVLQYRAMRRPQRVGQTTSGSHAFFMSAYQVKSLIRYHHDMEKYCATSDVKCKVGDNQSSPSAGLTSNALPEVLKSKPMNLQTGVSTNNALSRTSVDTNKDTKDTHHWYALRTTYGREKKVYTYLTSKNVVAFYPTLKRIKIVDGKRVAIEESRIPNIFFAYGTEDELKAFVYDNVNLPYLRFYYRHTHVGNKIVKVPLIVPDDQMNSLKIICAADSDDIVASTEVVEKFKSGQKVRIIDGKFKGVVGVVARYHSQQRVGIVIDGLLTVCTAFVPSAFIENT